MSKNKFKVGDRAYVPVDELRFEVEILAVKNAYGRIRYLVRPVGGKGEQVVEKLEKKNENN